MEKKTIKNIERRIKEIAKDYEARGFVVTVNPRQSDLPGFLKGFEPDIIARNENESVVIEVKTRTQINELKRFEELAERITQKKNWRFELVFTNPQEQAIQANNEKALDLLRIRQRLLEINKLKDANQFEASFLLGWATLEAAIRLKLKDEKGDFSIKATLAIIKTLFSLGLINQHDYKKLEKLNSIRNYLIHGFDQRIDKQSISELLNVLNYLIGESKEALMYEWLDGLDLDDYEDIYSLYRAAAEKDKIGGFNYIKKGTKIILTSDYSENTLELENEKERKQFLDLIETEYMDEMSPEGWYAFKRAMEKDD